VTLSINDTPHNNPAIVLSVSMQNVIMLSVLATLSISILSTIKLSVTFYLSLIVVMLNLDTECHDGHLHECMHYVMMPKQGSNSRKLLTKTFYDILALSSLCFSPYFLILWQNKVDKLLVSGYSFRGSLIIC
jgi:hypothetical protein